MHGDATKYWASLGPKFHGGPMVLNETLARHKAFLTSSIFARKFDPTIYADVLPIWDEWMAAKLPTQSVAPRQPEIASNVIHLDPLLGGGIPSPTAHEHDPRVDEPGGAARLAAGEYSGGAGSHAPSSSGTAAAVARPGALAVGQLAETGASHHHRRDGHGDGGGGGGGDDDDDDDDDGGYHGHHHAKPSRLISGLIVVWVLGILVAALVCASLAIARDLECRGRIAAMRGRLLRPKPDRSKA